MGDEKARVEMRIKIEIDRDVFESEIDAITQNELIAISKLIPAIKNQSEATLNLANVAYEAIKLGGWEMFKLLVKRTDKQLRDQYAIYFQAPK